MPGLVREGRQIGAFEQVDDGLRAVRAGRGELDGATAVDFLVGQADIDFVALVILSPGICVAGSLGISGAIFFYRVDIVVVLAVAMVLDGYARAQNAAPDINIGLYPMVF
ncbi:MAG: hypothetical protein QM682_05720 [Paracoccus sp. (in: a-proteobacteria)]